MEGTEKSIPALAALLADEKLSQEARIALESMPYAAAGAVLREAVGKAQGLALAGVIDSLGQRRDERAVPLLAPFLTDKDSNVQAAAALALGKIGTPHASKALWAGVGTVAGDPRVHIGRGLLACADRLANTNNREEALEAYSHLGFEAWTGAAGGTPVAWAAVAGYMRAQGKAQSPEIRLRLDVSTDFGGLRDAAATALPALSPQELRSVADNINRLPAFSETAVLAAIRINGDGSLAPAAIEAAGSKNEAVALAAINALGNLDSPAAAEELVRRAAGEGKLAEAARKALAGSPAADVDERIAAAMRVEKDPARRAGWLAILQARPEVAMVPLLLKEAIDADPAVRGRAVAALVTVAGPKDLPGLTAAALRAEKGAERDAVERAVVLIARQIANPAERADWLLAALEKSSPADRAALLPMLGRLGGPKALAAIHAALADADRAMRDAGLHALCNWPDASVADELLKLAQAAKEEPSRLLALRAFIRVAVLPDRATPDAQKLARLEEAMKLATRDEERAYVLERAAAVRTLATLVFALPYLDQPALAEQAAKTVVELAHHRELRDPNKAQFKAALEKVLKVSKDQGTVDLAKRYLQAM